MESGILAEGAILIRLQATQLSFFRLAFLAHLQVGNTPILAHPINAPMQNLQDFFRSLLDAANASFDNEQYDESMQAYEELLMQPQLPWTMRVKANANIYELVDG